LCEALDATNAARESARRHKRDQQRQKGGQDRDAQDQPAHLGDGTADRFERNREAQQLGAFMSAERGRHG
jgi:hypothetical protein